MHVFVAPSHPLSLSFSQFLSPFLFPTELIAFLLTTQASCADMQRQQDSSVLRVLQLEQLVSGEELSNHTNAHNIVISLFVFTFHALYSSIFASS
jgi:hypothetical protein